VCVCVCVLSSSFHRSRVARARGPTTRARSVRDQPPTLPPPHPYIMTAILSRPPASPSRPPSGPVSIKQHRRRLRAGGHRAFGAAESNAHRPGTSGRGQFSESSSPNRCQNYIKNNNIAYKYIYTVYTTTIISYYCAVLYTVIIICYRGHRYSAQLTARHRWPVCSACPPPPNAVILLSAQ